MMSESISTSLKLERVGECVYLKHYIRVFLIFFDTRLFMPKIIMISSMRYEKISVITLKKPFIYIRIFNI